MFIEDLTRSSLSVAWGQQQRHRRRRPGQKERVRQDTPTPALCPPRPPSGAAADPRYPRPPPAAELDGEAQRRLKCQRGRHHSTGHRKDWDRPASNNDIFPPRRFAKVGRPSKEELRLRALLRSATNANGNEPGVKEPSNRGKGGFVQGGRGRGKVANSVRKRFPNNGRVGRKHEETFNGRDAPNVQRIINKPASSFGRNNNFNSTDQNGRTSNLKSIATVCNSSSKKNNNVSDRNSKIPRSNQYRARQSVSRAADHLGAGNIHKLRPTSNVRDEARSCSLTGKRDALKPLPDAPKSSSPLNYGPVKELHPRHVLFALERSRPQFQIIADKIQGAATVSASSSSSSSSVHPTKTSARSVIAPPVYIKQEPL